MPKKIIILCLLLLFTGKTAFAQVITEYEATPSIMSEGGAILLISEINLKNSQADWIELYYYSPTGRSLDLNGISFADDKIFKQITNDFVVQSDSFVTLTYKGTSPDVPPDISSEKTGLTGTTEQIIIYDQNDEIIDAACWSNKSPTATEIDDQNKLFTKNGWHSSAPESCIQSEEIKTDESLIRLGINDTNTKTDWAITNLATPGKPNVLTIEETTQPETNNEYNPPEDSSIYQGTQEIHSEQAKTSSDSKTTSKSASKSDKNYTNGNLGNIVINEIMPNPEGNDSKNEWIEIYNKDNLRINLGNWKLDDDEGGSKPYIFPDSSIIDENNILLVKIEESKISLGNKEDKIRLFNFKDEIVDEISYEEAPSGQSYALIQTINEDGTSESDFIWSDKPTPDKINPTFIKFTAEIVTEPQFENSYFFEVKDKNGQLIKITFSEDTIPAPLAKATFKSGTLLDLILENVEDSEYQLIQFEVLETKSIQQSNLPIFPLIIISFLILGCISLLILRKKIPLQPLKKTLKNST